MDCPFKVEDIVVVTEPQTEQYSISSHPLAVGTVVTVQSTNCSGWWSGEYPEYSQGISVNYNLLQDWCISINRLKHAVTERGNKIS